MMEPDLALPEGVFWEGTTLADLEDALGQSWEHWAHQCHDISLRIVRSGLLVEPNARVARGWARGVSSQHSWVVLGGDVYDKHAEILDATLWSYDDARSPLLLHTHAMAGTHRPHGTGSIFDYGMPASGGDELIVLTPDSLTSDAQLFLELLGPLDRRGWMQLFNAPVGGWPAKDIITVAAQDQRLSPLIPIDTVGMVTDLNPRGLYR